MIRRLLSRQIRQRLVYHLRLKHDHKYILAHRIYLSLWARSERGKAVKRASSRKYYRDHPEARVKALARKRSEDYKAKRREHYRKNRARLLAQKRAYVVKNRERLTLADRAWRLKNKALIASMQRARRSTDHGRSLEEKYRQTRKAYGYFKRWYEAKRQREIIAILERAKAAGLSGSILSFKKRRKKS